MSATEQEDHSARHISIKFYTENSCIKKKNNVRVSLQEYYYTAILGTSVVDRIWVPMTDILHIFNFGSSATFPCHHFQFLLQFSATNVQQIQN